MGYIDYPFIITLFSSVFIILLGVWVFLNNRKSTTNILFTFFCIFVSWWGLMNYLSINVSTDSMLSFIRLSVFTGIPHTILFYFFIKTFPYEKINLNKKWFYSVIFFTCMAMFLSLTPFMFSSLNIKDGVVTPIVEPGILLITFIILGGLILGIINFFKRYKGLKVKEDKKTWRLIGVGFFITLGLLVSVNFFGTIIFSDTSLIPISPLFVIPFIILIGYTILRHGALGIREITTDFFVIFFFTIFKLLFYF